VRRLAITLAVLVAATAAPASARGQRSLDPAGRLIQAAAANDDLAEDALYRQIRSWSWPAPRLLRVGRAAGASGDPGSGLPSWGGTPGKVPGKLDPRSRSLLGTGLGSWELQGEAARRVGRHIPLKGLRSLRMALRGPDAITRAQAALALGWARDPGAAPFVLSLLADPDPVVRARAATALGVMDDRSAVGRLQIALRDSNLAVREAAARALGHLGDPAAVAALRVLAHSEEPRLRRAAWDALSRLGDRSKVSILRDALGDAAVRSGPQGEDFVRRLARAAGTSADAAGLVLLAGDLTDPDPMLRRAAVVALAAGRNPLSTDALLGALSDPDGQVRALAAQGLAAIGSPRAVLPLVEALGRRNVRLGGVDQAGPALVALADTRALAPLGALARGTDPLVAADALLVIARMGGAEDAAVVDSVLAAPRPEVRAAAAMAIAGLTDVPGAAARFTACATWGRAGVFTDDDFVEPGKPRATPAPRCALRTLMAHLRDADSPVRLAAAVALGKLGDARAYGALFDAARDRDPVVADAARLAMGQIGIRHAADPLHRAARGGSLAAARGLAALGQPQAASRVAALMAARDPAMRGAAAGALREHWSFGAGGLDGAADRAAASRLGSALRDRDRGVRIQAALALAEFPGSGGTLRAAAAGANPYAACWFAAAAIRQAGNTGRSTASDSAWAALDRAFASPDAELRRTAAEALGWLGNSEGARLAARHVRDRDPEVRAAAAVALARTPGKAAAHALADLAMAGPWREAVAALDALDGRDLRGQDLVDASQEHRDIRVRWAGERLVMRAERFDITLEK